jgi:hypothetical protein
MMRGGVAPSVKAVGNTNSFMAAPAFAARFLAGRRALEPRQCVARVVAPAKALGISQGFVWRPISAPRSIPTNIRVAAIPSVALPPRCRRGATSRRPGTRSKASSCASGRRTTVRRCSARRSRISCSTPTATAVGASTRCMVREGAPGVAPRDARPALYRLAGPRVLICARVAPSTHA